HDAIKRVKQRFKGIDYLVKIELKATLISRRSQESILYVVFQRTTILLTAQDILCRRCTDLNMEAKCFADL
ncbi:hypothetical protein OC709_01935, partial ['Planchonia careya' phytoplasma]